MKNYLKLLFYETIQLMKTKIFTILFSLVALSCIFTSCNKCPNPPKQIIINQDTVLFKPYIMPYKNFDTIRCLRNGIDTVLFFGGKYQYGYNNSYTQEDCPQLVKGQWMGQMFSNQSTDSFYLYYYVSSFAEGSSPLFNILFNRETFGYYNAFDMCFLGDHPDSMYVLNKLYLSPVKMIQNPNGYPPTVTNDTIYYRNGIVRIKYMNTIYEKIP